MKKVYSLLLILAVLCSNLTIVSYGAGATDATVLYDDFTDRTVPYEVSGFKYENMTITPNWDGDPYGTFTYLLQGIQQDNSGTVTYYGENFSGKVLSVVGIYEQPLVGDLTGGWGDYTGMASKLPIKIYFGDTLDTLKLYEPEGFKGGGAGNSMYVEYFISAIPQGTKYIKLEMPAWNDDRHDRRRIGRVEVTGDTTRLNNMLPPIPDIYANALTATDEEKFGKYILYDTLNRTVPYYSLKGMSYNTSSPLNLPYYGPTTGVLQRASDTVDGSIIYENADFGNRMLSVLSTYYRDLVVKYNGETAHMWDYWQNFAREIPVEIYAGDSIESLKRISPTHFMVDGVGNDMAVEYMVEKLPADTRYIKLTLSAKNRDPYWQNAIRRVTVSKDNDAVIGTYAAEYDMDFDGTWEQEGFTVSGSPDYTFRDKEGTSVYNPVAGGTAMAKASVAYLPGSKVTMLHAAYSRTDNRLLGVALDTKEMNGDSTNLTAIIQNLPENPEDLLFKTIFCAGLDSLMPLTDNSYPYKAMEEEWHAYHSVNIASPALRSDVYGDNIAVKAFVPGFERVSMGTLHQPDAENTGAGGYYKLFANNLIPNADGYVEANFPAYDYPYGPLTITIDAVSGDYTKRYYLQLYNEAGVRWQNGAADAPTPVHAEGMKLAFTDDFDQPLSIATAHEDGLYYTHTLGWVNPDDPEGPLIGTTDFGGAGFKNYNSGENPFAQKDSYLRIRAMKNKKEGGYSSGLLSSEHNNRKTLSHVYGYWECRILCPPGKGTWPAFWLLSTKSTVTGPVNGSEIDILEGYGKALHTPTQAWHLWAIKEEDGDGNQNWFNLSENGMLDIAQSFHTYAGKITEDYTYFYIDDVEVYKVPTMEEAKVPMFFLINLALEEVWDIDLQEYDQAVDMYVDYVRVYVPADQ